MGPVVGRKEQRSAGGTEFREFRGVPETPYAIIAARAAWLHGHLLRKPGEMAIDVWV
jgi:hypothetical protein